MKNYIPILLLSIFSACSLFGQHPTCDGMRYLSPVFPNLDSTKSILFGANDNAWGFNVDLEMDIYSPAGDTASQRPAIVFAFGEGFLSGEREDVAWICREFAHQGFVVANVDYRKYPGLFFTDSSQTVDAAIKGTQDVKAAVRFLREDAATNNLYRVDPNFIFAGGVSSGAISACYTAYMDTSDFVSPVIQGLLNANGGLEGTSNTLQRSSAVQGVINWSGGLKDDEMMDANDPPIYSAHDTGDPVVPYASGTVTVGLGVDIFFEGSATLKLRADALGIWNDLYSVNSNTHVSYLNNSNDFPVLFQGALEMMHNVLCPSITAQDEAKPASNPEITLIPNPSPGQFRIVLKEGFEWEKVEIFNFRGQRIKVHSLNPLDQSIALSGLKNGLYWVIATTHTGAEVKMRLLIQN